MHDDVAATRLFHCDRLHQPAAADGPVSRIFVDVLAEKTGRTMIREAVALDTCATTLADEILYIAGEETGHTASFALPSQQRIRKRAGTA